MIAPRIETPRLVLRAVQAEDYDALVAIREKKEVGEFVGGVRDARDTWFMMMRTAGMWPLLGYGYWTVDLKETGEVIGEVGFADFKRGIQPDISGIPEAGWVFDQPHWGKGFATEAVTAALGWLDTQTDYVQSSCLVSPDHKPSIGVAKKCGYVPIVQSEFRGDAVLVFKRNKHRLA